MNKPIVSEWAELYFEAFQQLNTSRQWSQTGPVSIPYMEIYLWLNDNNIFDIDERSEYVYVIQKVDNFYVKFIHDKLKGVR